jgi:hypothetical protein
MPYDPRLPSKFSLRSTNADLANPRCKQGLFKVRLEVFGEPPNIGLEES